MTRILRRLLPLLAALLLLPAALAAAASSSTPTTSTGTSTSPVVTPVVKPQVPKPKHGSLKLYLPDSFFIHQFAVNVPNRRLHVEGIVSPWVPGQRVTVRSYLGGRLVKTDRLRVRATPQRHFGRFSESLSSPGLGYLRVVVTHARTSTLTGFSAHRGLNVLNENIGFGSIGWPVLLIQRRLEALHFYIPQTGVYDQGTGLAIDAYHRLLRWGTYQTLDAPTVSRLLAGVGTFHIRFPGQGDHAEGNLGLQLLALSHGSKVDWILPISSGKPSTPTILGNFRIYRRVPYYRPDGMYFSSYFISGYAIHGYNPAPDYPASHGCMRLPMVDAIPVYNWLNFNDWVDTYY
jgi:hypothetical protein